MNLKNNDTSMFPRGVPAGAAPEIDEAQMRTMLNQHRHLNAALVSARPAEELTLEEQPKLEPQPEGPSGPSFR